MLMLDGLAALCGSRSYLQRTVQAAGANASTSAAPVSNAGHTPSSTPPNACDRNQLSCQVPPRLSSVPARADEGGAAPTVVASEGTSVLVRELERVHLRNKVRVCTRSVGAV